MLSKIQTLTNFLAALSATIRVAIVVFVVTVIVVAAVAPSATVLADEPVVINGEASGGSR